MSGYYLIGKEELLSRVIPDTAGVWVVGVNTDYDFNEGQTQFDFIADYIILEEKELTSVTFTDGILNADDVEWIAAGAGLGEDDNATILGVVIYFSDGDSRTLFAFIDGPAVGLPLTLKGANVTAIFDETGILQL